MGKKGDWIGMIRGALACGEVFAKERWREPLPETTSALLVLGFETARLLIAFFLTNHQR